MPVLFDGHNLSPLVEIELTDLPKSGSTMAPLELQGRDICPEVSNKRVCANKSVGGTFVFTYVGKDVYYFEDHFISTGR